jgi:predicted  nucleic acid-binding Zn-ribbon protein
MKTQIILIALISIGIYIYLNSIINEKFEIIPADRYLNNPIKDSLIRSSQTLDSINYIKPINKSNLYDITEQKIKSDDMLDDPTYARKELIQKQEIDNLKNQINSLITDNIMVIPENTFTVNSVKSLQNSQPLNINKLDNGKYMINMNGKCLKSNALNRTSIKSCNQDDPSQYFELNMIYDKDTYKNNIGRNPLIDSTTFKYPFSIIKSVTNGNCLTNIDSVISTRPCIPDISQQWENSNDPIVCTYESV